MGRIGKCRRRTPTAAKIALPVAGATTVVPGSRRCPNLKLRDVANAKWRIGVEIGILYLAFDEFRPFVQRHAEAPKNAALDLSECPTWINNGAGVYHDCLFLDSDRPVPAINANASDASG